MASESAARAMDAAGDERTALDVFRARVEASGNRVALRHKEGGAWRSTTWDDWNRESRQIAGGLVQLGVEPGDRVVILANTRREWVLCDVGILMAGAVTVPIYPSSTADQCQYIINDCGAKVIIAEDPHQIEKLLDPDVRSTLSSVSKVVWMSDVANLERPDKSGRTRVPMADVVPEGHADSDWFVPLEDLSASGKAIAEGDAECLDKLARGVRVTDAATFVYTSGTTGPPKGVVLTHGNLGFESEAVRDLLRIGVTDEQVLFLPLAHIFAKILCWAAISTGAVTAFAESVAQLIANMQEIRPTFVGAVPRVYEKAYAKIRANFEEKRKKPVPRMLINWALKQGESRSRAEQRGEIADGFGIRLADKLVFDKVRQTFGGRLRFFISGGAPLSRDIAEFFHSAGVLILEGYGLTETTAATCVNLVDNFAFGTVGPPIPGVEVKIADDGEVLVRGPSVLREYYNKPEATAEAIDKDGWFHTGDIGEFDSAGRLRITDRKKDIIVTAGGKNVAPQNLENAFKSMCPLASQIMVYGDKRKYLSALITVAEDAALPWAKERDIAHNGYADLTQNPALEQEIQRYISAMNADLPSYETIKKFKILPADFDQETGELTPTLKVKRKFCSEKYKDILEGFYAEDPASTL